MPPKIVIDASIAFKTLLPFQQSSLTAQRFGSWMEEGYRMVVPDLWLPEVISGICRSAYQWAGRLGQARVYDGFYLALSELYELPLWSADRRLVNRAKLSGADWVHWSEEPLHQPA
jgi:predicted nucleic acid-binding protein